MKLSDWETICFSPYLWDRLLSASCGFNALALLSGFNPFQIKKKYKRAGFSHSHDSHCSEDFAVSFLRKWYDILKLDEKTIQEPAETANNVTANHLLLMVQSFSHSENSYVVTWQGMMYHNFEIYPLKPMEFINRPIKSMYILKRKP